MAFAKWEKALAAALRLARNRPGVLGVDFGFVYKDGVQLKSPGIRFHVGEKLPLDKLPPEHVLPSKVSDFRSDVLEVKYALQTSPRDNCDPIQPGVSIGNVQRSTTGTMGLEVIDNHSGRTGLISNWHVLCGSPAAQNGEKVCQPGPLHAGSQPPRVIATLERWALLDHGCDASLAVLEAGISVQQRLFDSQIAPTGVDKPRLGMKLVKYGAVSGLTHGITDGIGGAYQINYSAYDDTVRWIDGIRIVADPAEPESEISLAGDSGAVWVDASSGKAIALHFAGEDGLGPTADYALAQPLRRVLDLLDAEIK